MTAPPTQDWEDAIRAAERSLRRETTGIPAMSADQMDGRAGVHAIFGEPVERDGVTVIPVGRTLWGFGGGEGLRGHAGEEGEGCGGGGGVMASPVGCIEISGGSAAYRRIRSPASPGTMIVRAAAVYVVLRALRALRR